MMTVKDIAWCAGFFEGEGCVYIHKKKQKTKLYYSLLISISNTHKEYLNFLKQKFNGYIYDCTEKHPNRKRCYCFLLHGDKATEFLKTVFPYLKGKKKEAMLGIRLQKLKYGQNRWKKGLKGSLPFSEKDIEKREKIYQELKVLNKRGLVSEPKPARNPRLTSEPPVKRNPSGKSEPHQRRSPINTSEPFNRRNPFKVSEPAEGRNP